jgi:hypothetical protein
MVRVGIKGNSMYGHKQTKLHYGIMWMNLEFTKQIVLKLRQVPQLTGRLSTWDEPSRSIEGEELPYSLSGSSCLQNTSLLGAW